MINIFVGGLPYATTEEDLKEMFEKFGEVSTVQIIMDRQTNQSKGFGFVEMPNEEDGQKAIKELNGSDVGGRKISVSVARRKEPEQ